MVHKSLFNFVYFSGEKITQILEISSDKVGPVINLDALTGSKL